MSSHNLEAKNDDDAMLLYTDLVWYKTAPYSWCQKYQDVFNGKISSIISGQMPLKILYNSIARL